MRVLLYRIQSSGPDPFKLKKKKKKTWPPKNDVLLPYALLFLILRYA